MPGCYRGVPHDGEKKRARLDRLAAKMRAYYLTHGNGCKTRAKVIERRTGGQQ